jgi:hypothetical protein
MNTPGVEPYQHLRSDIPGVQPCPEELADGEIAVNTADGIAYYKDAHGRVQLLNGPSTALAAAQRAYAASLMDW